MSRRHPFAAMAAAAAGSIAILPTPAEAVSYGEARATGAPHACEYRRPSFFGETTPYKAHVQGSDFHAVSAESGGVGSRETDPRDLSALVEPDRQHYYVIDDVGYAVAGELSGRLDLARLRAESRGGFWDPPYLPLFLEGPTLDAECVAVASVDLALPAGVEFSDRTDWLISEWRKAESKYRSEIDGLPFVVRLPEAGDETRIEFAIHAETSGWHDDADKRVFFDLHRDTGGGRTLIRIRERMAPQGTPTTCAGSPIEPCDLVATTPAGTEVHRTISQERAYEYSFVRDGTLVRFYFLDYEAGATLPVVHRTRDPADGHPFLKGELEAFVDSFAPVSRERLYELPGM